MRCDRGKPHAAPQVSEPLFDPKPLLQVLHEHDVDFVVVGVMAAVAQGSPVPTRDLDVTPSVEPENYERLAGALRDLEAKLRLPDGTGMDFPIEPNYLAGNTAWTLLTRFGVLDLVFIPAGTRGFDDLRRHAVELDLGIGKPVLVASLIDVVRMKEAAGRPKDQAALPAIRQTLEVIRRREREAD
jgi:hypothetical protein